MVFAGLGERGLVVLQLCFWQFAARESVQHRDDLRDSPASSADVAATEGRRRRACAIMWPPRFAGAWRTRAISAQIVPTCARHALQGLWPQRLPWVSRWSTSGGPLTLTIGGRCSRSRSLRLAGLRDALLAVRGLTSSSQVSVGRSFIVEVWRA